MQKNYFTIPFIPLLSLLVSSQTLGKEAFEMNERVNSVYQAIVRIEVVSERGRRKDAKIGFNWKRRYHRQIRTSGNNHHVAGKATRLTCRLYDGEKSGRTSSVRMP